MIARKERRRKDIIVKGDIIVFAGSGDEDWGLGERREEGISLIYISTLRDGNVHQQE